MLPDNLPTIPSKNGGSGSTRALYVENLHYTPNDLTELRRLAEINPDLAQQYIAGRNHQVRHEAISERLGIVVAGILAIVCVAGAVTIILALGPWQAVLFVLAMLGVSHLVRTVLTGEWSETSWFGAFLKNGEKKNTADSDDTN